MRTNCARDDFWNTLLLMSIMLSFPVNTGSRMGELHASLSVPGI